MALWSGLVRAVRHYRCLFRESFYNAISNKSTNAQDIITDFSSLLTPRPLKDTQNNYLINTEAKLAHLYNNYCRGLAIHKNIYYKKPEKKESTSLSSIIDKSNGQIYFLKQLSYLNNHHSFSNIDIEYILSKIDFTENIKSY